MFKYRIEYYFYDTLEKSNMSFFIVEKINKNSTKEKNYKCYSFITKIKITRV